MSPEDHPVHRPITRTVRFTVDPMHHYVGGAETCDQVEADACSQLGVTREDPGLTVQWFAVVTVVGYDDGRGVQMPWTPRHEGRPLALPRGTVRLLCKAEHVTPAPAADDAGERSRP